MFRKGYKMSEEHKRKIGNANKGKIRTEETKKKIGKYQKNRKRLGHSEETKRKIGIANSISRKGLKLSDETKRKIGKAHIGKMMGEKNWNWKGGISENFYPSEFNKELKLRIRRRNNFTCCLCSRTEREELEELNRVLCVNHIDFDKNNCKEENLNTLCLRCNVKINRDREYWIEYFNAKN